MTTEGQTEDKLWEQVQQDRAGATTAESNQEPGANADAADPLAGVPEETRKLIEGLKAKTEEQDKRLYDVGQKLATAHGTMGSMKQQLDESRKTLEKFAPVVATVEDQKKVAEQQAADEAIAKRKALREKLADFPDVLEYVDSVLPADVKPAAKDEPKTVVENKTDVVTDAPDAAEKIRVLTLQRELSDRVPGWLKIRETPEFKAWLPAQNAAIKAKCESWDPDESASVFKAFEQHKVDAAKVAQVEKDRQERLRRGESVQGRGGSAGNADTGSDALWDKVKRDRAKAQAA